MAKRIDLNDYRSSGSKVFAGRSRGNAVRLRAKLDEEDSMAEPVEVHIPPDTFSVNSSFFLGLFGDSIRHLDEEGFRAKYKFHGKDVSRVLDDCINEALRKGSPLEKADLNGKRQ